VGSLTSEVASGDRRRALEALREHLAEALESPEVVCKRCGGPASATLPTAAVAKELRAVVDELDRLTPVKESKVDELNARRQARHGAPEVPARAGGGDRRRGS
jgi:hypothetical protein